jgi:beta-lactamase class A
MYVKKYYVKEKRKLPSKSKKVFKYLFSFFSILFLINFLLNVYFYKSDVQSAVFISPLGKEIIFKITTFINSQKNSVFLEKIVQNVLKNESKDYGVYIYNLTTGERYYFNENKIFETASLYKLWVMAVSYEQIESGKFKETDVLEDSISSLNKKFNIASESAELTDGSVSRSVKDALEQMIIVSDNYSALLLTQKVGISEMSNFLSQNGFLKSKVGTFEDNPVSSAYDIGNFFQDLYFIKLANLKDTDKMLTLLKNQKVNTKLSKDLPKDAVIGHKTGELGGFSHDGGIVSGNKGDYIIVLMSDTTNPQNANEKIAEISKEVYSYFTK